LCFVNGQQLSGAAKWVDIVYEIDNQSVLYHLPNVIDRYMNNFAQDAMKTSCTVAAAMDTGVTAGKKKCF
jgi:hypothetical protein